MSEYISIGDFASVPDPSLVQLGVEYEESSWGSCTSETCQHNSHDPLTTVHTYYFPKESWDQKWSHTKRSEYGDDSAWVLQYTGDGFLPVYLVATRYEENHYCPRLQTGVYNTPEEALARVAKFFRWGPGSRNLANAAQALATPPS